MWAPLESTKEFPYRPGRGPAGSTPRRVGRGHRPPRPVSRGGVEEANPRADPARTSAQPLSPVAPSLPSLPDSRGSAGAVDRPEGSL